MNGDPGFEVQVKQVSTDCKIQGSTKRFLMFLVRSCSRFIVRGPLTLTWLLVRKKATVMLMTWSWRQIWDVDDKIPGISILVTFLSDLISQFGAWRMSKKQVDPCDQNGKNRHQHLKFVINTFLHQHRCHSKKKRLMLVTIVGYWTGNDQMAKSVANIMTRFCPSSTSMSDISRIRK